MRKRMVARRIGALCGRPCGRNLIVWQREKLSTPLTKTLVYLVFVIYQVPYTLDKSSVHWVRSSMGSIVFCVKAVFSSTLWRVEDYVLQWEQKQAKEAWGREWWRGGLARIVVDLAAERHAANPCGREEKRLSQQQLQQFVCGVIHNNLVWRYSF